MGLEALVNKNKMNKEKFVELAEIMQDASKREWDLYRNYGVDTSGHNSRYNEAIDILGEAYFGNKRWWELMDYLFNPELTDRPESISDFFDKWKSNDTATYDNIQFNYQS